jgi:hypothetical protein
MLDLIEIELTRVRKMAEHADDEFLLYLIDIAIIEANTKARLRREADETADSIRPTPGFSLKTASGLQVVR